MLDPPKDWLGSTPVLTAVARTGSATAAGRELGLSPATVLRQVGRVERALGLHLFDRTPTGMAPTEAFGRLAPILRRVEAAVDDVVRLAATEESQAEGTVRLATVPGLANAFLVPWLPALLDRHPRLELELLPSAVTLDLTRREADLAIRLVRPASGDLVAQRVYAGRVRVVAAPALLNRVQPRSLSELPWIGWERDGEHPEARWVEQVVPGARCVFRSDDIQTQLGAAQLGVGAMVSSEALAVATGGLVEVPLSAPGLPEEALWLVAHRAVRRVPRIDAVWNWLIEHSRSKPPGPIGAWAGPEVLHS